MSLHQFHSLTRIRPSTINCKRRQLLHHWVWLDIMLMRARMRQTTLCVLNRASKPPMFKWWVIWMSLVWNAGVLCDKLCDVLQWRWLRCVCYGVYRLATDKDQTLGLRSKLRATRVGQVATKPSARENFIFSSSITRVRCGKLSLNVHIVALKFDLVVLDVRQVTYANNCECVLKQGPQLMTILTSYCSGWSWFLCVGPECGILKRRQRGDFVSSWKGATYFSEMYWTLCDVEF